MTNALRTLVVLGLGWMTAGAQASDTLVDLSFDPGTGSNGEVSELRALDDGKILVLGHFTSFNSVQCQSLVRLEADGRIDSGFSFHADLSEWPGPRRSLSAVTVATNGNLVVAITTGTGEPPVWSTQLRRVRRDGSFDATFHEPTILPGGPAQLAVQHDGKILVGINRERYSGTAAYSSVAFYRFLPSGELDTTFQATLPNLSGAWDRIKSMALDSQDRLWAAGEFYSATATFSLAYTLFRFTPEGVASGYYPVGTDYLRQLLPGANSRMTILGNGRLVRLDGDGQPEPGFTSPSAADGGVNGVIYCAHWLPDGRVFLGGSFTVVSGMPRPGVAALAADGRVDPAFDPLEGVEYLGGHAGAFVGAMTSQADGKLLIAGRFSRVAGHARAGLARLNTDPLAVRSWFSCSTTNLSLAESGSAFEIEVIRTGEVSGEASVDFATVGITAEAGLDFEPVAGRLHFMEGERLKRVTVPLIDDKLEEQEELAIFELSSPEGAELLPSWGRTALRITSQDLLVEFLASEFTVYEGQSYLSLSLNRELAQNARIVAEDGSAKAGHDFLLSSNSWPAVQAVDNTEVDGARSFVVRLVDPSPNVVLGARDHATVLILDNDTGSCPGRGANGPIQAVCAAPEGRWYVAGDFSQVDGRARRRVARVLEDGALDVGFDPELGADGSLEALAVQPDGRLLVGGSFTNFAGQPNPGIVRLLEDGSLDPTFHADPCPSIEGLPPWVTALAVQSDGKILVGSRWWWRPFCPPSGGLTRLHPDGSLDLGFQSEAELSVDPRAFLVLSDRRIFIGDNSTMLLEDGRRDASFTPPADLRPMTEAAVTVPDGTLWVAASSGLWHLATNGSPLARVSTLTLSGLPHNFARAYALFGLPDGGVLLGGYFNLPYGSRVLLVRLNAAGVPEPTFEPEDFPISVSPGVVCAGAATSTLTFAVAGSVGEYQCPPVWRLCRLDSSAGFLNDLRLAPPMRLPDGSISGGLRGQSVRRFVVEYSEDLKHWQPLNASYPSWLWLNFQDPDPTNRYLQRRFYRAVSR